MAKEETPPKVGDEIFGDFGLADPEARGPEVGEEIFAKPVVVRDDDGKAVAHPVGAEVFSEEQLEGIVPGPITLESTAAEVDATPSAQEHAEETGVDLTAVTGTGKGGVITKQDVKDAKA